MTAWKIFGAIGVGVGVMAAIYAATAYEEAGTAMLALSAVLSLWAAVYLRRQDTKLAGGAEADRDDEAYLPHESVWPLAIGLGTVVLLNGLIIGGWFFLPGGAVLLLGVGGWINQSRARS